MPGLQIQRREGAGLYRRNPRVTRRAVGVDQLHHRHMKGVGGEEQPGQEGRAVGIGWPGPQPAGVVYQPQKDRGRLEDRAIRGHHRGHQAQGVDRAVGGAGQIARLGVKGRDGVGQGQLLQRQPDDGRGIVRRVVKRDLGGHSTAPSGGLGASGRVKGWGPNPSARATTGVSTRASCARARA